MALAYLLDPTNQYQNVAGVNNVAGWFEVFISDTPERADVYVDFAGTRAPERIGIDNDGRAVMIVYSEGVYRVEMHAPNGDLLWTQYPVWPVGQGGGGAIGVDIGSSDGSIDVQRTQVGSVVNYDLSVAADGTDLLGWGEYIGYTMDGTHMVPSYNAGTIETGSHGIRLHGGQYYHVTVTLGASSVEQNVYDAFQVSFKGVDGDGVVSTFTTKSFHYDASTGEGHSYDVSFDMMPTTDVEMYAEATGVESGISVGIAEVYVHRVYSGAPAIPGGVADKEWVEENYQEKLTAGTGITIEDNVISATAEPQVQADWAQNDPSAVDYIKHKPTIPTKTSDLTNDSGYITSADLPTVDQVFDASSTNAQSGTAVAEALTEADNTFFAVYGVTTIGEVDTAYLHGKDIICRYNDGRGHVYSSQLSSLLSGMYTFSTTDGFTDYEFKLSPNGGTGSWSISSRVIPSGTQLVPEATQSDAGEVLTVDQNGVPEWAQAQAPISAGNGIDITNDVISVDTSVIATKADLATKQDTISDLATIRAGAAAGATAVQDPNYVHTDNNYTNADAAKLSGIESGAEANVQADWTETDSSADDYIKNKPTTKHLVAGANITITDSNNNIIISASTPSVPVQDVQVGGTSVVNAQGIAEIPRQVNADWNSSAGASEILNKPNLATVATSGSYTDLSNTPDLSQYATTTDLAGKADKVTGATSGDIAVLDATGNLTDTGVSSANLVHDASYVHTDENFTSAEKTKLSGIETGAEVNVQADWTETDTNAASYIQHKPTIPSTLSAGDGIDITNNVVSAKVDGSTVTINASGELQAAPAITVDQTYNASSTNPQSGTAVADALSDYTPTSSLATVATSGSYADLSNTPTIPTATSDLQNDSGFITASDVPSNQVQSDWNESDTSDPAYIQNKPTIPVLPTMKELVAGTNIAIAEGQTTVTISATAAPQVQADWSESDTSDVSYIQHKPDLSVYALSANLATVATSGDYADLTNKPTVPTTDQQYNPNSTNPQSGTAVAEAIAGTGQVPTVTSSDNDKVLTATYSGGVGSFAWQTPSTTQVQADWTEADSSDPSYIQNKPTLATVATSGSYNDLADKPTIPAAQVNSDWSANSGVAQILNKPTVKPVQAGSNITITETANDFTIAASVPVIGTITV